jgi:nitrogen regulatory protein P-II 1
MIKIEVIIRPEKLDEVLKAIERTGYSGVMITEIKGHGKQKGLVQQWRGDQYRVTLLTKMKLEIVARDVDVDKIRTAIVSVARTGEIGDGKIFTYNINDTLRIRTGETGEEAL